MASYGRLSAFKPAVNIRCFPSQRRASQKTGSHTPFAGLFALSSRHWPHSLCKRGNYKHTLSQRPARPTPGNGYRLRSGDLPRLCVYLLPHQWLLMGASRRSSLPFTTVFLHNAVLHRKLLPTHRSMVYFPCLHVTGHIPFARGANVNIRFCLYNAILHRKLVPTDRSMVYFPCLHVTGHIPFASRATVNIRFFRHNAILHRKLVPTHRSMVYFPCFHVTGHIPFASRANVNIRFFRHNAILHGKLVPTDRSMVYFPCLHVTGHIPFASRANVNIRFFRHNAVLHGKLVPTHRSMVYFPCLHVTGHIPIASRANVNIRFFRHNASFTENWFPQTVRWSIRPVFTSLATFPLQAGQI